MCGSSRAVHCSERARDLWWGLVRKGRASVAAAAFAPPQQHSAALGFWGFKGWALPHLYYGAGAGAPSSPSFLLVGTRGWGRHPPPLARRCPGGTRRKGGIGRGTVSRGQYWPGREHPPPPHPPPPTPTHPHPTPARVTSPFPNLPHPPTHAHTHTHTHTPPPPPPPPPTYRPYPLGPNPGSGSHPRSYVSAEDTLPSTGYQP